MPQGCLHMQAAPAAALIASCLLPLMRSKTLCAPTPRAPALGAGRTAHAPISSFRPQKPQLSHRYSQPHRLHWVLAPGQRPSEHADEEPQYLQQHAW